MHTIHTALKRASLDLQLSTTPKVDAEILLAFVLNQSKAYLYTYPEYQLSAEEYQKFLSLVQQRTQGIPIAYLTGHKEFWSLLLSVSPATLIPRPETELLVETTLESLDPAKEMCVLDLGTGSGAIALALAKERPQWKIWASDKSQEALSIAKKNAQDLKLRQITFLESDWYKAIPSDLYFDAIIANPPYISPQDPHLTQGDLRFEPISALASTDNGLADLKAIITTGIARLKKNGLLLVEHGHDQQLAVEKIFNDSGYKKTKHWQDWNGNDRLSAGWVN